MNTAKNRGFTLIETVVAGVLMMVLAFGLFTLFNMYTRDAKELTADFRMERNYDALMDDLGRNVRSANLVLTPAEHKNPDFSVEYTSNIQTPVIILRDSDGNPKRAYSVEKDYVEVSDNGIDWRPFSAGSDTMWISKTALRSFFLSPNRLNVQIEITLIETIGEDNVDLHVDRGTFQCRL
jgi:type II secretory pathway pseudopilin PulG